ncbi:carbonic anhydrase [Obelidium mucronatum]|nr:carbonic anhydrase [Obelidium mucronatum]
MYAEPQSDNPSSTDETSSITPTLSNHPHEPLSRQHSRPQPTHLASLQLNNLSQLAFGPSSSPSSATAASARSPDPTHDDTLSDVLEKNREWSNLQQVTNPGLFEKLALKQQPEILWIGCSDARVPAENICGLGPGDLFVHRNIANVVVHTDLSMLSVLQYAVDILKVKYIVVCGHYKCGGCMSAMSNKQFGLIDNWLRNIKDTYSANAERLEALDEAERGDVLVELNVAKSVYNLCHTTIVQNAWARGQYLSIHGWVYRLSDGRLEDLQLCINHKEEVTSIYSYVTNTGIHNAARRGTSVDRFNFPPPRSPGLSVSKEQQQQCIPQSPLATVFASPPAIRSSCSGTAAAAAKGCSSAAAHCESPLLERHHLPSRMTELNLDQ